MRHRQLFFALDLVIAATGKILEKVSDKKIDADLVKETLKKIK